MMYESAQMRCSFIPLTPLARHHIRFRYHFGRMKTGKLLFFVGHGINVFEVLTFGRTIAAL